ncbi:hypothetical protein DFJ73DRAFT_339179 [Zopfochytrium polystomum]|nr:hypothetical protein DFJ73DRAFT_339179 [Zopfochytrium polystomum]
MASTFQTPQHATRGIDATRLQAPSAPQIASRLPSVSSPHSSFQQLRQPSQHSQQHQPQHQQQQAQSPHTARRQTVLSFGKVTKTSAPSSRRLSRVPTDDDPILSWTDRDSAAPLRAGERRRTVVSIGQSTSFGFSTDQPAVVTAAAAATAASRESETTESVGNATNGVTSRSPSAASSMVTRSRRTTNEFLNFSDVDELHVAMTQIEARARKPAPRADGSFFPNSVDGAVWNKEWNQLAAVRRLSDRRRVSSGSTVEEESLPELPKLPSHADSVRLRTLMAVRGVGARSENVSDESAEQQTQSWTWNGQILEDKIAENIEKVIRTTSSDFPNVQLASTARLNSTMKRTSAVPGTPTMSGLLGLNSATQNIVTNDHHNELPHTPKPLRRLELGRCPFFSDPDLSGEEPELRLRRVRKPVSVSNRKGMS